MHYFLQPQFQFCKITDLCINGTVKMTVPFERVKKAPVGATLGRPWILPKQNPSPQGENAVIFLRKIRKTTFFGGRARLAPTILSRKQVL